jgi:signal transduction histidine kinase
VNCRLELPVELPPFSLAAETRHNLFLMVKEALNNALKHSGASKVRVGVTVENDSMQIIVEDNGHGFDAGALGDRTGNGLQNMRKRIESLGGQFEISSAPQRGTSLKAVLKLKVDPTRAMM